ncbi:MarR family winged helix-turn-helix transcriptional regulator [Amorphus coralli]|uniref:MarR family winged helix-turn-helix transcriptional regulator n=1 Tax=Amorphus coralli TaxID=340680 RepID=UPI000382CCBC|nr:MarR family transcriptional regulator [Amorphus coralli]
MRLQPTDRAIALVEEFRKVDPEMQLQTVWLFLLAAKYEPCSQNYLTKLSGYTRTTVSRNMAILSEIGGRGREGHDLVAQQIDPEDRRSRIITLTPKGRAIYRSVQFIIGGDNEAAADEEV